MRSEDFNLLRKFWCFVQGIYGMLKLQLMSKSNNSDFCHLFYKWIFYVYEEGSCLDHARCGVFSEYLLTLLVVSKYVAAQGLRI